MEKLFIPCPLCKGTDIEKISERDTATGSDRNLYYCRTCACFAPPESWNRPCPSSSERVEKLEKASFMKGMKVAAGMENLAHARAFDAWSTASELLSETFAENDRLKKEVEFFKKALASSPAPDKEG